MPHKKSGAPQKMAPLFLEVNKSTSLDYRGFELSNYRIIGISGFEGGGGMGIYGGKILWLWEK